MNISDVNANISHRSDILRNNSVGNSGQLDASGKGASATEARESGDRVEISADARGASKDVRDAEELIFARKALDNVPSLSQERINELTNRIKSGYYQQTDVIDQIAKRAGSDLAQKL